MKSRFSSKCLLASFLIFNVVSDIHGSQLSSYTSTSTSCCSSSMHSSSINSRMNSSGISKDLSSTINQQAAATINTMFMKRWGVTALVVPTPMRRTMKTTRAGQSQSTFQVYHPLGAPRSKNTSKGCLKHQQFFMQKNHEEQQNNNELFEHELMGSPRSRHLSTILHLSRGGGDITNNNKNNSPTTSNASTKSKNIVTAISISLLITLAAFYKDSILAFNFKEELAKQLDLLSSMGTSGLITYIISFLIWELVVGVTTPVETAAGMAFGFQRGIIANAIGKTSGAILAFLMGRFVLKDYVSDKLQDNEYMGLVKDSITKNPIRVALIWRFSFLPEQIKNFGLAILPVQTWQFVTAVLLHGFPFTLLWTFMGNEMGLVVKGIVDQPSKVLKFLIVGVNILGFFVSPTLVGMWVKGLRDEKVKLDGNKKKK